MPLPVFAEEPWFQWLPVPALGLDAHGRLVAWNREAVALTGYRPHEVVGRPLTNLLTPEHGAEWQARWLRLLEAEAPTLAQGPLLLRTKKGAFLWVWSRARRLLSSGEGYVLVTFQPNMGLASVPPQWWEEALDQDRDIHERAFAVIRIATHMLQASRGWVVTFPKDGEAQILARFPQDAADPPVPLNQLQGMDRPRFLDTPAGCVAGFPMQTKGQILGVLLVSVPGEAHIAPEARLWLQTLASWTAEMVASAWAREKEARERFMHDLSTRIMQRLNAEPDLFRRFPAIAEDIRQLTGCDRVSLALLQGETFIIAALDKPDVVLSEGITMPLAASSAAEDVLAGRPHFTPDLTQEATHPVEQQLLKAGYRARLNLPLKIEDRVLGALSLAWRDAAGWSEDVLPHLMQIASAMAQALERSRLLHEENRRRRTLESMYDISRTIRAGQEDLVALPALLKRIHKIFDTQGEVIVRWEPRYRRVRIMAARGLFAPLARKQEDDFPLEVQVGEYLLLEDPAPLLARLPEDWRPPQAEEVGPMLILPLAAEGYTAHYFLVLARKKGRPVFNQQDLEHIRVLGELLSHTLARVRALEEARSWLVLLQALHRLDRAIVREPRTEVLYRLFFLEARRLLGVDAMAVYTLHGDRTLVYVAGQGWPQGEPQARHLFLDASPLLQHALAEHKRMILQPPWEDPQIRRLTEGLPPHHLLVVAPLSAQEYPPTLLFLFGRHQPEAPERWEYYLDALISELSVGLAYVSTLEKLRRAQLDLEQAYDATIEALARAVEMRDFETEHHTRRVTELTVRLARAMGIPEEEIVHIRRGALLHDIGKLAIPDRILLKPGPLDEKEWAVMRMHPVLAYEMLKDIAYLQPALVIPYCHHERWDGSGYPRGLKGEEIPLPARIFAVADVWDALTHKRPYRPAWSPRKALEYICEQAGKHFDPRVVEVFYRVILEDHPELADVPCLQKKAEETSEQPATVPRPSP